MMDESPTIDDPMARIINKGDPVIERNISIVGESQLKILKGGFLLDLFGSINDDPSTWPGVTAHLECEDIDDPSCVLGIREELLASAKPRVDPLLPIPEFNQSTFPFELMGRKTMADMSAPFYRPTFRINH